MIASDKGSNCTKYPISYIFTKDDEDKFVQYCRKPVGYEPVFFQPEVFVLLEVVCLIWFLAEYFEPQHDKPTKIIGNFSYKYW